MWVDSTRAACLNQMVAWLNITMTLIRQVYYVLPATTLSPNQCNCIMQPCWASGDQIHKILPQGYYPCPKQILQPESNWYAHRIGDTPSSSSTPVWALLGWPHQVAHMGEHGNHDIGTGYPRQSLHTRLHSDAPSNDQFLILSFAQSGIGGTELSRINQCRIYLQVTTLADICNGTGAYILPDMWAGWPKQMFTTGYQSWPNQGWLPKKIGYCDN